MIPEKIPPPWRAPKNYGGLLLPCCRTSDALLGGDEQAVPLVALLHVSALQAQPLFHGMLRNWFLVKDCQSADSHGARSLLGLHA